MTNKFKISFIVLSSFLYAACTTYKPFYAKKEKEWQTANNPDTLSLKYTVFLVGDVGNPDLSRQEPTLKLMESQMFSYDTVVSKTGSDTLIKKLSNPKDVAIFLGDNIYDKGLPEPDDYDREEKEKRLVEQLKIVKDFKGRKIFIPGNHDWNHSRPGGLAAVKRQEQFVEQYLDSTDVFIPSNGCAGPVEVRMNKDLVIIVLDSEWWLHKHSKSNRYQQGCTAVSKEQVLTQVKDIILKNKGKNILFTQHHPLFSNGKHGGYFTLIDYIFPLTLVKDNLYIPLPILGSLYPLLRQYGLSRQDISNKDYQQLKNGLLSILNNAENVVFAAGHEHALQFTKYQNLNHIISGAGSKNSALFKGNNALFGHGTKGFARLNYYTNGQCWVEFWEPVKDGSTGKLMYRKPLYATAPSKAEIKEEDLLDLQDSMKYVAVGKQYRASNFKKKILGEHYRNVWATPVEIPYLDLTKYAGGLKPLQLGGGKQTTSLRMIGKDSIQYQFRTVNKDPSDLLPNGFETTFADDFLQDQISSAHPFGALTIPEMASAAGIYHTKPQLVYMPYSRLLGPYLAEVGGRVGIIEIRPDENLSLYKNFGRTKNAIGTETLYEKLKEDNDNEVDQKSFLKARLFDMLIGDWDRHEDQWRWAEFEKDKGAIYRPIPRDRDQVYTKFDGLLPSLFKSFVADIQHFGYEIKDPAELSIAARNLDRNFLNELNLKDWQKIAKELQTELTDSVITSSIKAMPKEAFMVSGNEIIEKLKSRRNQLHDVAVSYYKTLAKEVTIAGSDKYEYLEITREADSTLVCLYKTRKEGNIDTIIYSRKFDNSLTKELNFFLLDERDSAIVKGKSKHPLKIRIVGGDGKDRITDTSNTGKIVIYDTPENNISGSKNTRIVLSNKAWINQYTPNWFKYDKAGIAPSVDYPNGLDGPSFGLSHQIKRYGFRKDPYAFEQKITALYAPKNGAFEVKYRSIFHSLFAKKYDLVFSGDFAGPAYSFNYYGIGNSTPNENHVDFYRVRSRALQANAYFQYRLSERAKFGIGPGLAYVDIMKNRPNSFIGNLADDFSNTDKFITIKSYADLDLRDRKINPQTGFRWLSTINYIWQTNAEQYKHLNLYTSFSGYATPNISFPVTFAIRLGAETNIGDYQFYHASSLGNNENLRGFRNQRFSGKTAYFANTEVRIPVTKIRGYILTGDFGVFGFYDTGRVHSAQIESNTWHQGYGPGVWLNLFDNIFISLGYGFSREDKVLSFNTGFRF
ncbi:outer membrane protein/protective antigen OMA87 [Pedobacter glucosidilyticus]|nr:BamA/TamA family outer membrane protein [Pedobacter glucosidilyticus]KHJ36591.1 outer membrane protein/protective antigen OMA87 [Pedobacter glucosidilyticus]